MVLQEQLQIPYASLVKRLSPAAVETLTRKEATVRTPSLLFSSPIIRSLLGEESVLFGQRGVQMTSSLGSGVIMRPASLAETSNHVIASSTQAIGTSASPRMLGAEIVHTDKHTDVAALKVDMGDEMLTVEALT